MGIIKKLEQEIEKFKLDELLVLRMLEHKKRMAIKQLELDLVEIRAQMKRLQNKLEAQNEEQKVS